MDEDRKREILAALAARHGVDKESPAIAEEWQNWSGDNQHLAGASLGDAVQSFVTHLTKRGIISTTSASTEAAAPTAAHRRHVSNASALSMIAPAGGEYDDDDDDDDELLDGGAGAGVDEDLDSLLAPARLDDFSLEDSVTLDEARRAASPLRSGDELFGGGGDDDPDYGEHGAPAPPGGEEEIDRIMREIYELDLDGGEGAGAGLELELAGRRPRFLERSRFVKHTRMSAKLTMLVNFAARHRAADPRSEAGDDVLEKMRTQGMDVGRDVAAAVTRYVGRRPDTDTKMQEDHLRALPAVLVVHWIAALGWANERSQGEAEWALRYLRDTLADYRARIFETPEMAAQYGKGTTLQGGALKSIDAPFENTMGGLRRGAAALGTGATALGRGAAYGTKKAFTSTARGGRKLKSFGRAGLNSKERASIRALLLAFVQQGKLARGAIAGHGSSRVVAGHISSSGLLLKRKARDRAEGTVTSLIELLVGLVHAYVTDERFAKHAVKLVDDVTTEIEAAGAKRQLSLAGASAGQGLARIGAAPDEEDSGLLETTRYAPDGSVISATRHGAAGAAPDEATEFANRLVGAAAAYLRDNPSCVKKAGEEFVLLVPADAQHRSAVAAKLAAGGAAERKRYLQGALLARHPNAELDAQGHMLSLSGRPYHVQRAGAALRVQRMRRAATAAPKHEDVWDTELRNAGGALVAHGNHRAMHCEAPRGAGARATHTIQASAHAGSKLVDIRPLHYRVASQ